MIRTAMLLSGGVDSSVAMRMLLEDGRYDITAFYIKIWLEDELAFLGDCPWQEDLSYVEAVCRDAGVPLEIVPLQAEYFAKVVEYVLDELRAGRTPSPDILCNQQIKFGEFCERIGDGFEVVASGHYAEVVAGDDGLSRLRRSPDATKDQTYFLHRLSQAQVSRALFPIGHLRKAAVRQLAAAWELPNRDRKDSQGICFLGKISYPDFVTFHLGTRRGEIRELETGRVLGEHDGYWFYTIGQRQGLGLGGGPWYVAQKDVGNNAVLVTHRRDHALAERSEFSVRDLHWIAEPPRQSTLQCKLRHGPAITPCELQWDARGQGRVRMAEPDAGVAAGQSAVLYDGEWCLGGGVIV